LLIPAPGHRPYADLVGLAEIIRRDIESLAQVHYGSTPDPDESRRRRWRRVTTHDGFKVLALTRVRESARRHRVPAANHLLRMVTRVLYGIDIGNEVHFGVGVRFTHTVGSVIGGPARIGDRVQLMGGNTVGTAKDNGCPIIGDDVVLGCGSRILGPIVVGAGALVGANAVVLGDVPDGATAVGIPARILSDRSLSNVVVEPPLAMWLSIDGTAVA
jgi:serine O-acetyltransferase